MAAQPQPTVTGQNPESPGAAESWVPATPCPAGETPTQGMVHTGSPALPQENCGGRSESLPEPPQPLPMGPNRAMGEGSSHRVHTSLFCGADVQHCVVLEDAAVLEQPDLAHICATVVHLYILQLDRAIPEGKVPLPLCPVPEMAHRDAMVVVVIKHHLLLPGHRKHQV